MASRSIFIIIGPTSSPERCFWSVVKTTASISVNSCMDLRRAAETYGSGSVGLNSLAGILSSASVRLSMMLWAISLNVSTCVAWSGRVKTGKASLIKYSYILA